MSTASNTVCAVFRKCVLAIRDGVFITRTDKKDKEFHFQNWFKSRLDEINLKYDQPGRNKYPNFTLVNFPEGYEVKGLAYPEREFDYDCNSQVPRGRHNGREIFYVFGRYSSEPDGDEHPVLDLVICHGGFLNADSTYIHKNIIPRGFGSYGDILDRDRKMYVAPTPFALAKGTAHHRTLILPAEAPVDDDHVEIATFTRCEVDHVVTAYTFDLNSNEIKTKLAPNPNAGRRHAFKAYRLGKDPEYQVTSRERSQEKS